MSYDYKELDLSVFKNDTETDNKIKKENFVSQNEKDLNQIYDLPTDNEDNNSDNKKSEQELKDVYYELMKKNNVIDLENSNSISLTENSITLSKATIDKFLTEKRQIRIRMNFYKRYSSIITGIIQRDGVNIEPAKIKEKLKIIVDVCERLTISYIKNLLKNNKITDKATDWAITQLLPIITDLVITNWQEIGNINKTVEIIKNLTAEIEDEEDSMVAIRNLQFEETKIYPMIDDKNYIEAVLLMSETKGMSKIFQHLIEIDLNMQQRFIWQQSIVKTIRSRISKKLDDKISRSLDKNTRIMFMQNQMNSCYKLMYSCLTRYTKQELNKNIKPNDINITPLIESWKSLVDELDFTIKKDLSIINTLSISKSNKSVKDMMTIPNYSRKKE